MSKTSKRRPRQVSRDQWESNFERTFGPPRLSGHAAWEQTAEQLGGRYTPDPDGDGGTLVAPWRGWLGENPPTPGQ